jgi:hypothetical protein
LIVGSVHCRSADGNTLKHDLSFQASMKHFAKFVMAKPSPSQCSESALAESHRQLRGMVVVQDIRRQLPPLCRENVSHCALDRGKHDCVIPE